jgi:hypothetical protein
MNNDFLNYAVSSGLNSMHVENIMCASAAVAAGASTARSSSYISPTILEERKLNVSQMDVFSRLMMDRIIKRENTSIWLTLSFQCQPNGRVLTLNDGPHHLPRH